ncbi:hypothetical protein M2101_001807 [Parabacteroides sp. PM5-20]|nr:hypothetical protein [Parabacteroides sp. PM5-20]
MENGEWRIFTSLNNWKKYNFICTKCGEIKVPIVVDICADNCRQLCRYISAIVPTIISNFIFHLKKLPLPGTQGYIITSFQDS